ncbi:pas domain s-box [Leptolyngbya sp. Heron Island J]|uniref:PAS domain-containing protein n=1 Tax=Leptolyngbya sp. Heron Island J TaxID=1385935 RepID=UPI0003B9E720|nr:PAS domain-containing protein [Leptolyngbya sp. Heron Island J]ESA37243.1 pas domain s-box [Leptolyngbya sp. Heron Island J]
MSDSDPVHPAANANGVNSAASLRHRLLELEQEKADLQLMLDMALEHSDMLLDSLHQQNRDLILQLEQTSNLITFRGEQQAGEIKPLAEQFKLVTEALPMGLIIARIEDGQIVYGNPAICQLLRVSADQLEKQKITDFCYGSVACEQLVTAMLNRQPFNGQLRWSQSGGRVFDATVSLQPIVFRTKPALLSVIQTAGQADAGF